MGSRSDWPTLQRAAAILDQFGVPHACEVVSAHRTPAKLAEYAGTAADRGLKVIIAGAGGAAHLPGMLAAQTHLPVLGVPVESAMLRGIYSLLSIEQIGRIRHPMAWTLHDMWAFCGSEHYLADPSAYLGPPGTVPSSGPSRAARWTWNRKRRAWAGLKPIIVAPSRWLGDLAAQSRLLGHLPVEVVPYGLDLDCFRPLKSPTSGRPRPTRIVFGAAGGTADPRKGFDLFAAAIGRFASTSQSRPCELVFFGAAEAPKIDHVGSMSIRSAGIIGSDTEMAKLLADADVFVSTSRLDNLPNTVLEATACGVPTVAFNIGGMPDMIDHQTTGYLARAFDVNDLADGLSWVLADESRLSALKTAARMKAERDFGSDLQAERMLAIYERAMGVVK